MEDDRSATDLERCIKLPAQNVARNAKCPSSLPKENRSIAGNVTEKENHISSSELVSDTVIFLFFFFAFFINITFSMLAQINTSANRTSYNTGRTP